MKYYNISVEVKSAEGTQIFGTYANSKKEALEKFKNGEDDFVEEDVEVTSLFEFDIDDIYEVEECFI